MKFVKELNIPGIVELQIGVSKSKPKLNVTVEIDRKKTSLGLEDNDLLTKGQYFEMIVEGGKSRLRPVLLTAITTVLGLIPLAIGLNIDFFSLFTDYDPKIYFGGNNVIF